MLVKTKGKGFTLIELLIVIAVISILAALAYPSYQESVRKGKRTEATGTLLEISQRLERCYTQYNVYNNALCTTVTDLTDGNGIDSENGEYNVTVAFPNASSYTLTATAQGTQASDTNCGNFTYTSTGVKNKTGTKDVDYCW